MTEPSLSGGPLDSSFEKQRTTIDMKRNHETSTMVEWKNILRRGSVGRMDNEEPLPTPHPRRRRRCGGVDTPKRVTHDSHERDKSFVFMRSEKRQAGKA